MKKSTLNKKAIETISVNAVRDSIVMTDYLDQFIADNDKEPSWDGFVYIYKEKEKKKDQLKGRIPVQVKGTEKDDLSKEAITFPIAIADLNNYLNDGGVMFFVVYIGHGGLVKQIYYVALSPVKIRVLIAESKMQKTKNIELKKFPPNANEKEMILFNFYKDRQKQSSFSKAKLFSYEELERKGVLDSLSISVTPIGVDTKTALLTNEVYLYANIKGSSIPQPLEVIPEKMVAVEERPSTVTVGGKTFYNKVSIYQDANSTTTMFGESFSIIYKKDKTVQIKYYDSPKLRTLVKDLDFMLSYIREGEFSYNNISFGSEK